MKRCHYTKTSNNTKVLTQQELLDLFRFRPEGMGIDISVSCNINKNICWNSEFFHVIAQQ